MIDDWNQRDFSWYYPIDRVEGYTISQLENVMSKTFLNFEAFGLGIFDMPYETFSFSVV